MSEKLCELKNNVSSAGSSSTFQFSTSEQATGLRWTGGQIIYAKTWTGGSAAKDHDITIIFPSGMVTLVDWLCIVDVNGNKNYINNGFIEVGKTATASTYTYNGEFRFSHNVQISSWACTLFYTKS
jgi:hypothetical protein